MNNKYNNQTACMLSLICTFIIHKCTSRFYHGVAHMLNKVQFRALSASLLSVDQIEMEQNSFYIKLELMFMKHYAPNRCLYIKVAKLRTGLGVQRCHTYKIAVSKYI